jgi:hypothetical protein
MEALTTLYPPSPPKKKKKKKKEMKNTRHQHNYVTTECANMSSNDMHDHLAPIQPRERTNEVRTYNHACMSTHVEIIVSRMNNLCVNNCPWREREGESKHI